MADTEDDFAELEKLVIDLSELCGGHPLRPVLRALTAMVVHYAAPHLTLSEIHQELRDEYFRQKNTFLGKG